MTNIPEFTIEQIITIISAVAAVASAFLAWRSARISKLALHIAQQEVLNKNENIKTNLENSFKWRDDSGEYASFACTYVNHSILPNTIEKLELVIHPQRFSEEQKSKVRLTPITQKPNESDLVMIDVPINLEPRVTISGWLTFKLPPRLNFIIDRFEICATTSSGKVFSIEAYLLLESLKWR